MSQQGKYLVFPVAFLQIGKHLDAVTPQEAHSRICCIIGWCIHDQKTKILSELEEGENEPLSKYQAMAERHRQYASIEADDLEQIAYLAAEETLGWLAQSLKYVTKEAAQLEKQVKMYAGKKLTRVRTDFISNAMSGEMNWREFAVLSAVYAVCFDDRRKASSVTMAQLSAMAAGFGSVKQATDNKETPHSKGHLLHTKAIGRTVEKLRLRGCFVKASPDNGRHTFYSNSLSQPEMQAYVASIKVAKFEKARLSCQEIQRQVNATAEQLLLEKQRTAHIR